MISLPEFPKRIEIELASACNLSCVYCPRRFLEKLDGYMDFDLFKKLIDEAEPYPETILVLHRRGESLLHKEFIPMMEYIKGKFKTVQMATNATKLDKDKARAMVDSISFLSFSIDTPHNFEKIRVPARYEKVKSNILNFLDINQRAANPATTQVSMVAGDQTTNKDIEIFKSTWQGKVDRIRIYEEHSSDGAFGSLKTRRPDRKPCTMPFYELLIYCDGSVGRCNHDWDGPPLGRIGQAGIRDIWHSPVLNDLRRQHLNLDIKDPVCQPCDCWYPKEGLQDTGKVIEK